MGARRGESTPMPLLARVGRRQPHRLLGELGRSRQRAPLGCERHGVVESGGDGSVRRVAREREVTGTQKRVVDDLGQTGVDLLPLGTEVAVENRRQQRVSETNSAVLTLDHVRGDRRRERISCYARLLQERHRGRAERRRERQRVAGRRGQPRQPRADELVERRGDGERLERVDVHVEGTCQLLREEWIAARPFVDAEQSLSRKGLPEAIVQKPVERPHTQRSHRQQLDALRAQRPLHRRRLDAVGEPPGEQQQHGARGETAQRERERARRRCVEPLHVVDCQQHRASLAEHVQHVAHRDTEGAVVDRFVCGFLVQQRNLERPPPRHRQQRRDIGEDLLEEVAETDVRETPLGLRGPRREHDQAALARRGHPFEPERRLADPRLAVQHEPGRSVRRPADEGLNGSELPLPADDLGRHLRLDRARRRCRRQPADSLRRLLARRDVSSWVGAVAICSPSG